MFSISNAMIIAMVIMTNNIFIAMFLIIIRERVAVEILSVFKEQTSKWGVTVERVEVF